MVGTFGRKEYPRDFCRSIAYIAFPVTLPERQVELPDRCYYGLFNGKSKPNYMGLTTVFDYTPRRSFTEAFIWDRSFGALNYSASYELDLVRVLMYERCCQEPSVREAGGKFMMLNAWNVWGEGMTMEPSTAYGYEFLKATLRARLLTREMGCDWAKLREYEETIMSRAVGKSEAGVEELLETVKINQVKNERGFEEIKNMVEGLKELINTKLLNKP